MGADTSKHRVSVEADRNSPTAIGSSKNGLTPENKSGSPSLGEKSGEKKLTIQEIAHMIQLRKAWNVFRKEYFNEDFFDLRKREYLPQLQKRFHLVLVLALAISQVVISYSANIENNKGVNYAALAGAIFSIMSNLSVSIGKAEHLKVSLKLMDEPVRGSDKSTELVSGETEEEFAESNTKEEKNEATEKELNDAAEQELNDERKEVGIEKTAFLPNICGFLIRVLTFATKKLLKKFCFEVDDDSLTRRIISFAYGLLLAPFAIIFLLVDMLTIQMVDTVFVLCAENIKQMPQLAGYGWAFSTLALALVALITHIATNTIAYVAYMFLGKWEHENNGANEGTWAMRASQVKQLLTLIPETVEEAVSFELQSFDLYTNIKKNDPDYMLNSKELVKRFGTNRRKGRMLAPLYNLRINLEPYPEETDKDAKRVVSQEIMFSLTVESHDWYRFDPKTVNRLGCNNIIENFDAVLPRRYFKDKEDKTKREADVP